MEWRRYCSRRQNWKSSYIGLRAKSWCMPQVICESLLVSNNCWKFSAEYNYLQCARNASRRCLVEARRKCTDQNQDQDQNDKTDTTICHRLQRGPYKISDYTGDHCLETKTKTKTDIGWREIGFVRGPKCQTPSLNRTAEQWEMTGVTQYRVTDRRHRTSPSSPSDAAATAAAAAVTRSPATWCHVLMPNNCLICLSFMRHDCCWSWSVNTGNI